jgi:hypothetical protein
MGRTSNDNTPLPLNNCPKQLSVSWESNPARVKASKCDYYLVYILKIFRADMIECNSIPWDSGTGLAR